MMYFCGLDVGTTGVKALVFDEKGNPLSSAHRTYNIQVEQDGTRLLKANELWQKTKETFAEAATDTGFYQLYVLQRNRGGFFHCLQNHVL
jgi:xylulokinase